MLDFALLAGDRRLNIEIYGERYHRNRDGELCRSDQIRNQRLFDLWLDVIRFWVNQVRNDLPQCLARVQAWTENRSRRTQSEA
jgi:very-short-patch-repair endonuclease